MVFVDFATLADLALMRHVLPLLSQPLLVRRSIVHILGQDVSRLQELGIVVRVKLSLFSAFLVSTSLTNSVKLGIVRLENSFLLLIIDFLSLLLLLVLNNLLVDSLLLFFL